MTLSEDPNPFGVSVIPDAEANAALMLAELPSGPSASDPYRMLVRKGDGALAVFDTVAHGAVTQIGPDVTFDQARAVASAVVGGDMQVITHPHTVHVLATCYLAALVAAEQRRRGQEERHAAVA